VYYRGFDLSVPDTYHYEEWKREFDNYVKNGNLPALQIMSLPLINSEASRRMLGV